MAHRQFCRAAKAGGTLTTQFVANVFAILYSRMKQKMPAAQPAKSFVFKNILVSAAKTPAAVFNQPVIAIMSNGICGVILIDSRGEPRK